MIRKLRVRWLRARAEAAAAAGDLVKACEKLERALPLAPGTWKAAVLNRLGALWFRQGDFERAARYYREAGQWARKPIASLHVNLANALDRLGLADEARAEYERAVALEPEHAGALFNLGLHVSGGGDARQGAELLRRALESIRRRPAQAPAGLTLEIAATALVNVCAAAGMRGEAEAALASIEGGMSAATLLNLRAFLASRTGSPEEALGLYRGVLEADPGFARAHFNVGMELLRMGDASRALESFERFARAAPDDPIGEFGLGYGHEALGHADLARKHYAEFLRRARDRRGLPAEFLHRAEHLLRGQN